MNDYHQNNCIDKKHLETIDHIIRICEVHYEIIMLNSIANTSNITEFCIAYMRLMWCVYPPPSPILIQNPQHYIMKSEIRWFRI